jgi:hypothetical protein
MVSSILWVANPIAPEPSASEPLINQINAERHSIEKVYDRNWSPGVFAFELLEPERQPVPIGTILKPSRPVD